jgi:hypothetical protein
VRAVTWLAFAMQLVVAAAVLRHKASVSLIALLNLVAALAVLAYWGTRWFGYLFRGVTWYATDQLLPACALVVCILALLTLFGRYHGVAVHWTIFGATTLVLLAAALFFSFFRTTRLFQRRGGLRWALVSR